MNEPRTISDDMPDKIKYAIDYLNKNNISLTEAELLEDDDNDDLEDDDISFDGFVSDDDSEEVEDISDDINEEDTDVSDLDSLF